MEIRQSEEAKKHCREMCPTCPQPSPGPESRGGPGRPAFLRGLPHGLLPPTGTLESPGAARGAALITDGEPPNSADLESLVFRSPGQPVALRSASLWAGLRLTSVPFCFQRETGAGRTCLSLCCWLAPARKGTVVVWEARPGEPSLREWGESHRPPSPLTSWALTPNK